MSTYLLNLRKRSLPSMPATQRSELEMVAPLAAISRYWVRAPSLAWTTSLHRRMASAGLFGLSRSVQFGIFERPSVPFKPGWGIELSEISQSAEDRAFASADLEEGCRSGIYQEISQDHAARAKQEGPIISSTFTVWQDSGE